MEEELCLRIEESFREKEEGRKKRKRERTKRKLKEGDHDLKLNPCKWWETVPYSSAVLDLIGYYFNHGSTTDRFTQLWASALLIRMLCGCG